ncbi:MAG TPA: DUF2894 domain-containing protein, partial [Ramlibacter sp.]|nr:DUF2894 domain-containing protein [Ramlibacter sp.]
RPVSEPVRAAEPPAGEDATAALQARVAAWRSEGAGRLDPVRFRYLEALARRLSGQPQPLLGLLHEKLEWALADYARRIEQAREAARVEAERLLALRPALAPQLRRLQAAGDVAGMRRLAHRAAEAGCAPLAQLNAHIRVAVAARLATIAPGEPQEPEELASVRRFRRAWSSSRTQDRVAQAAARKPANAGPLNSHALVLDSLALMRELSPDYLRRFVAHVEALQWLEEANAKGKPLPGKPAKPAKPARRARAKK